MRRLASISALSLLLCLSATRLPAQRELSGSARILQALDRLNVVGSVLMMAAHPDDENTAVLAYLSRGRHLRTGYLSLTRGEGGQNFIGREQGDALGVIRTQELLAARQIDGAEQFFSRAIDFGFSKTATEAIAKWGHDEVLADAVWVIRKFRPDVIILRFSGTPRDGHGHHQASAILGREAFLAAGDAKRFPEQLKWVQPWQAKRLVWNAFAFNRERQRAAEQLPDTITIDTGEYNPVLGYSYEEIAGMSRSEHRSQAMGVPQRKGPFKNYFAPVEGDPAKGDLLDGVDTTWGRIPGGKPVGELLTAAAARFDPQHPDRIVPMLLEARKLAAGLRDSWAARKLADLDEAIGLCAGLWMDASAENAITTPGAPLKIKTEVVNRSPLAIQLDAVETGGACSVTDTASAALPANQPVVRTLTATLPASQSFTQPYWLAHPKKGNLYTVDDRDLLGLPQAPPPIQARFSLTLQGEKFQFTRPVWHRYVDTALGERTRPLEIVPAVTLHLPETAIVFPDTREKTVEVRVRSSSGPASGDVTLTVPTGWRVQPPAQHFALQNTGEETTVGFRLSPPAQPSEGVLTARAGSSNSGMVGINYPHIPPQVLFPIAASKMVRTDVRNLAQSVGYIMGPGDEMPESLRQMGCEVTLLDAAALSGGDLSRFDAIVTGVRAHSFRPDMMANRQRLLDYVKNGGTLVVQYNRPEADFRPSGTIGPYPFTIGTARVSVEEAPVEFSHPGSSLLQQPNKITAADFEGWVQERGLYFATQWDTHYETVLVSQDPGEKPLPGGTLFARYGKGAYVFTAYAWFRQLPAGVPGAYRIFANMISAGKAVPNAAAASAQ